MSGCDIHLSITAYRTCSTMPFTRSKRNNTTATAKHIAVVRMSVGGYDSSTLGVITGFISILVIRHTCGFLVIRPCGTCGKGMACSHRSSGWVNEISISVWCSLILSLTNLSTSDGDMGISLNITILTAAIDRTLDKGMLTDSHIRVGGQA